MSLDIFPLIYLSSAFGLFLPSILLLLFSFLFCFHFRFANLLLGVVIFRLLKTNRKFKKKEREKKNLNEFPFVRRISDAVNRAAHAFDRQLPVYCTWQVTLRHKREQSY